MTKVEETITILKALGMPRRQINDRTAFCLLAMVNLREGQGWHEASNPLIGITPMMTFTSEAYGKVYAPNSRETFRRFSVHQLVQAGLVLQNPDDPERPVNSPNNVYQIEPSTLELLKTFGSPSWDDALAIFRESMQTLSAMYAKEREMLRLPVKIAEGMQINISPGAHSLLIKAIIEEFAPRFAPGSKVVYVGDTGEKWGYFDEPLLSGIGVSVDNHGKMPDVVLFLPERNWLLLIESVTSHGPVDGKRHLELASLFSGSTAPLVYVTAFPSRKVMASYISEIAWETEVWCADALTHLIHFNGERFLGPY
jgi:hypothetical protein